MTLCLRRYLSPLSVIEDSLTLARLTCVTNIPTAPIIFAIVMLEKRPNKIWSVMIVSMCEQPTLVMPRSLFTKESPVSIPFLKSQVIVGPDW